MEILQKVLLLEILANILNCISWDRCDWNAPFSKHPANATNKRKVIIAVCSI